MFHDLKAASQPLPPSQDPWYTAPDGFESAEPGAVLRVRPAPGDLTTKIGNAKSIYNILYRTTDSRYRPSWAVTTLLIPSFYYMSPSQTPVMLSYQFAYNTANIDSSPSYNFYGTTAQAHPSLGVSSNLALLNTLLGQGWIVNTPDYEGPAASFGASVQAGHATLDSVRAVLHLGRLTGGATAMTTALWGYSGGSFATMAAAELQVQYAPHLRIAGTALGGLLDDLSTSLDLINESPLAGTMVAALLGVTTQYPEAAAYLRSRLRPETAAEFLGVVDTNVLDALAHFAKRDIYAFFIGGRADLQAPILRRVFNVEMKLGYHGVPAMPLFIYKAIGDQYCPIALTDALVDRFGGVGADITYERNKAGGHVAEIENGKQRALDWLWTVFNESHVPYDSGCKIRDVEIRISPLDT